MKYNAKLIEPIVAFKIKGDVRFDNNAFLNISFVSGCALFCFPEILQNDGSLFTERFFFGEEDYEFSLRFLTELRSSI